MGPQEFTSIPGPNLDAPHSLSHTSSPEPGFSHLLDSATDRNPYLIDPPKTVEMAKFNVHNLLNGQYPPPDSGAGYLFSHVSLNNENF